MRILIVSQFFPPLNSIAALRPYSWAKYWSGNGHDVTVLTCPTNNPTQTTGQTRQEAFRVIAPLPRISNWLNPLKQSYYSDTTKKSSSTLFSKCKQKLLMSLVNTRNRLGIFKACRMPDLTDLWIAPALAAVRQHEPWDLVVSTFGPYSTHLVASRLKKRGQAKRWIADFRDPWSDNESFPGLFPFRLIERALEKRLMQNADVITTVSPPLKKTLGAKHGHDKTYVIENGVDFDDFQNINPARIFPQDGKFRIVHTGSIYDDVRNPSPLLQALQQLGASGSHIELIFVGDNGSRLPLEVNQRGLSSQVKLIHLVKREDALRMQRDADALLFLPVDDVEKNGIVSGKIFEYFYWSKPIIAVGGTSNKQTVEVLEGLKIDLNFDSQVEQIIEYLKSTSTQKSAKISSPLFPQLLERYSRQHLAEKMLRL